MLGRAVGAKNRRWQTHIRVAAEAGGTAEVGAQALDPELAESGKTRHVASMSRLYVLGALSARTRKGPIQRGESSDWEGRGVCAVSTVQQHLVPNVELHVPPGNFELRLAPVLPLLQQRPHLLCHAPQENGRVLAWTRWVRGRGEGKRAAGVLATIGVEGRVATPEGRRRVVDRELDQRHQGRPVVNTLAGEGAQDVGDDAVDAF